MIVKDRFDLRDLMKMTPAGRSDPYKEEFKRLADEFFVSGRTLDEFVSTARDDLLGDHVVSDEDIKLLAVEAFKLSKAAHERKSAIAWKHAAAAKVADKGCVFSLAELEPLAETFAEVLQDDVLADLNAFFTRQKCRTIGWLDIAFVARMHYLSIRDQGGQSPGARIVTNSRRQVHVAPVSKTHVSRITKVLVAIELMVQLSAGTTGRDGKKGTCNTYQWINDPIFADHFRNRNSS